MCKSKEYTKIRNLSNNKPKREITNITNTQNTKENIMVNRVSSYLKGGHSATETELFLLLEGKMCFCLARVIFIGTNDDLKYGFNILEMTVFQSFKSFPIRLKYRFRAD